VSEGRPPSTAQKREKKKGREKGTGEIAKGGIVDNQRGKWRGAQDKAPVPGRDDQLQGERRVA